MLNRKENIHTKHWRLLAVFGYVCTQLKSLQSQGKSSLTQRSLECHHWKITVLMIKKICVFHHFLSWWQHWQIERLSLCSKDSNSSKKKKQITQITLFLDKNGLCCPAARIPYFPPLLPFPKLVFPYPPLLLPFLPLFSPMLKSSYHIVWLRLWP